IASALSATIGGAAKIDLGLAHWPALLIHSMIAVSVATAGALLLGTACAVFTARTTLRGRRGILAVGSLLACVPPVAFATFALAVMPLWSLTPSAARAGAVYAMIYAPLAAIVMHSFLRHASSDLEDTARLDASPVRVLLRVTLPLASGGAA